MASESEETSFGVWNNSDLWNSLGPITSDRAENWSGCSSDSPTFSKLLNDTAKILDRSVDYKSDDCSAKIPVWPPVGSLIPDIDIPSIWSNPDSFSCNDQNLSLSTPNIPWAPVSSADEAIANLDTPNQIWQQSQEPVFQAPRGCDTWTSESESSHPASTDIPATSNSQSTSSENLSRTQGSTLTPRSDSVQASSGPIETPPQSTTAYSTEQLCDHLINSNDGWGRRPVDQNTPWDDPGAPQPIDHYSGFTTPTPGSQVNCPPLPLRGLDALESNVWTNETPTGTGIWEMYYDSCGSRSSSWAGNLQPGCTTPTPVLRPVVNPLLPTQGIAAKNVPQVTTLRSAHQRPWEPPGKIWGTNVPVNSRPVLGGSRSANVSEDATNWLASSSSSSGAIADNNRCQIDPNNGRSSVFSWENMSTNPLVSQWSPPGSSSGQFPLNHGGGGMDDLRRSTSVFNANVHGDRTTTHPLNSAYHRADLIKYLMSQGFKKEDVQAAVIDCNMDAERALHVLRERSGAAVYTQFDASTNNQQSTSSQLQALCGNLTAAGGGAGGLQNRNKLGAPGVLSNTNHSYLTSGSPANPHLIRQQITQQVRSALNLSLPNPNNTAGGGSVGGSIGNNQSGINAAGNSLLGQPPPLLNGGTGFLLGHTGPPNNGAVPGHNRTMSNSSGNNNNNVLNSTNSNNPRLFPGPANVAKRSDRQMTIMTAIQELQKKHQGIQQQLFMYRNNPAMCSQPQYADVFAELQGQMQQIEAQLRAKQAQLNIACAQDSMAACGRGQSSLHAALTGVSSSQPFSGAPSSQQQHSAAAGAAAAVVGQTGRLAPDPLVQHLMDLRIRPGNAVASDVSDGQDNGDFPTIGTWTTHSKGVHENLEKPSAHEPAASSRLPNSRLNGPKVQNLWPSNNNNNNNWQPGVTTAPRPGQNWVNGFRRLDQHHVAPQSHGAADNFHAPPLTLDAPPPSTSHHQSFGAGQWLMIHVPVAGSFASNMHTLHGLLSQFGLTHFHLLGPSASSGMNVNANNNNNGSNNNNNVLVRLRSTDCAVQLIRAVGDRLSIEPITDPEAVIQLQQQQQDNNFANTRPDPFAQEPNLFNATTSAQASNNNNNPNYWLNSDQHHHQYISSQNSSSQLIPKRLPPTHGSNRAGVMVSGFH